MPFPFSKTSCAEYRYTESLRPASLIPLDLPWCPCWLLGCWLGRRCTWVQCYETFYFLHRIGRKSQSICNFQVCSTHRHLKIIDCLTARVFFISTVNGRSKKRSLFCAALVAGTINKLEQSIFAPSISMAQPSIMCLSNADPSTVLYYLRWHTSVCNISNKFKTF
jgi:hypothetical protein